MKVSVRHIAAALALGLLLVSCSGKPRIIPRATLTDIYVDMFLADQWLRDHSSERSKADTTLFYDPIFAKYGYTFEDYDATIKEYLKDPEKFSKIFRSATDRLRSSADYYEAKARKQKEIREFNESFKDFAHIDFDADTLLWSLPDTSALDTLALDSLRRQKLLQDSLDRLEFTRDSLQRDSLRRDSLRRLYRHRDSLFRRPSIERLKVESLKNNS